MSRTQALKDRIALLLGEALEIVAPDAPVSLELERPKNPAHGDYSSNAAMQLARPLKRNPRELAQLILTELPASPLIARAEIAGAGFINFHLTPAAWHGIVPQIRSAGAQFGCGEAGLGHKVLVEFVSANPTGPLHVGHGRQAALGDAICNLYAAQGWQVFREFYYNDAGVQIATLATSVQARARGLKPGDAEWPESAYNGDYIADIAADFPGEENRQVGRSRIHRLGRCRRPRLDPPVRRGLPAPRTGPRPQGLRGALRPLLSGVEPVHQRARGGDGAEAGRRRQDLRAGRRTVAQDHRLRRRQGPGDEEIRRHLHLFRADVAYHIAKWERGFDRAINIQGTDHHGTIARVRAGLQAANAGIPQGYPDYLLHTMVRVMRGGEEVKISKRAGSYVTLRDLIEWTSKDAVRFFLLSRKPDTEYIFDVDLALARNNDNPVYYVQYAHARICRVFEEWGGMSDALDAADLAPLSAPHELALMQRLAEYPEVVAAAARELAPHLIVHYLQTLAGDFHAWYNAEKFLVEDEATKLARLALADATRIAIVNGLALLGVSAPEKM
jgi:arginyl-tRNA synthetase